MKIVHVIDELVMGGAQTHLFTMLELMAPRTEIQHEVWSICEDGALGERIRELGIAVHPLHLRSMIVHRQYVQARNVIEDRIRASCPDVLEAHLTWSRLLGLWAAKRSDVRRRIGFEHGDIYMNSPRVRLANFVNQHYADVMVVPSKAHAQWSSRTYGFYGKRLRVLNNCVDTNRFRPRDRKDIPPAWPKTEFLAAGVGTLGRGVDKRFDVLIKAVKVARLNGLDVGLVIAGDGEQRAGLQSLINSMGLAEVVSLLGSQSNIPEMLANCDVFCHSAPYEPFGIVAIEAMACGLPILVPKSGGIQEIVDEGVTGWSYAALNHHELGELIESTLSDAKNLKRMSTSSRLQACSRFSTTAYADSLEKLYCISESRATAG